MVKAGNINLFNTSFISAHDKLANGKVKSGNHFGILQTTIPHWFSNSKYQDIKVNKTTTTNTQGIFLK
ncbi:hypothetical protein HOG21_04950 [bacterium]|jgi:hypothetical protein|nr:hypothetical protein [bacterium]